MEKNEVTEACSQVQEPDDSQKGEVKFMGIDVRIVPVEYIGTAYTVRRRRHKKRRTDKKWLKRYGYVQRYRDDRVLMINGSFWMTRNTYERLKKSGDEQGWMT